MVVNKYIRNIFKLIFIQIVHCFRFCKELFYDPNTSGTLFFLTLGVSYAAFLVYILKFCKCINQGGKSDTPCTPKKSWSTSLAFSPLIYSLVKKLFQRCLKKLKSKYMQITIKNKYESCDGSEKISFNQSEAQFHCEQIICE